MLKKIFLLLLAVLVINSLFLTNIFAKSKETEFAERVKTEIFKLGVGQDARVKIKLKGGIKLKGYISEANESQFNLTNIETGQVTPVSYPQVKQVKGNNLSSGVKIAIGVGIAIAFIIFAASQLK